MKTMHDLASILGLAVVAVVACAFGQSAPAPAGRATRPTSSSAAATSQFAPFVFIHAGDPELGSPDLAGTARRFGQLAERANALGAGLVIIAGDLAHGGAKADELEVLDKTLKTFQMPVRAIPGNHDDLPAFRKRFGPEDSVFTLSNCDFVLWGSESFVWLETALKAARAANRTHIFVVMHRPDVSDALDGLLVRYGVEAVLAGHLHTTGQTRRKGYTVYFVSGTAKVRDDKGLNYGLFKVYRERIDHEVVPLEREVK